MQIPNIEVNNGEIINNGYIPIYKLNSKYSKALSEIKQVKLDLFIARDSFANINNLDDCEENYFLKQSLWFTGVMVYNRCFNSGRGRNYRLNESKHINKLEYRLRLAHSDLIDQRNKYIAHADTNTYEDSVVFGVMDISNQEILGISHQFNRIILITPTKVKEYEELVNSVIEVVVKEEDKVAELLLSELAKEHIQPDSIIQPKTLATQEQKAIFYHTVASFYCDQNSDYIKSLNYIAKAIELCPDEPKLYLDRATVYRALKDYDNQEKDLLKALQLNKHNELARKNYDAFLEERKNKNSV